MADLVKILYVTTQREQATTPEATDELSEDALRAFDELRTIHKCLSCGRLNDRFASPVELWQASVKDLRDALLTGKFQIIHFVGHASEGGSIIFPDGSKQGYEATKEALADLFKATATGDEIVVLNGCYTSDQAHLISQHVQCAIGMKDKILDWQSIFFSTGFYSGLLQGCSITHSFELGRNAIDLEASKGSHIPQIFAGKAVLSKAYVLGSNNETILREQDESSQENEGIAELERRKRDVRTLKGVFESIHFPSLDEYIKEMPDKIPLRIFHFWWEFAPLVESSIFYLYDQKVRDLVMKIHKYWGEGLWGYTKYYYAPPNVGFSLFRPSRFIPEKEYEAAESKLLGIKVQLESAVKDLVEEINSNWLEVDIEEGSRRAWEEYVEYRKRHNLV